MTGPFRGLRAGIAVLGLWAALASPSPAAAALNYQDYHSFTEVDRQLQEWSREHPRQMQVLTIGRSAGGRTRLESVGKSGQGRDLWMITITNPATGPELSKPAMYIDGNTHANEVQGGDTALYTVAYLLENYGRLPRITELLDRAVFYILPVVNPDGRSLWFQGPSDADFPRTVMVPVDDDRDGRADEDGFDDVDGDGYITTLRKKVPLGQGTHRLHPRDPRLLVPVEPGELGDWIELGSEGTTMTATAGSTRTPSATSTRTAPGVSPGSRSTCSPAPAPIRCPFRRPGPSPCGRSGISISAPCRAITTTAR